MEIYKVSEVQKNRYAALHRVSHRDSAEILLQSYLLRSAYSPAVVRRTTLRYLPRQCGHTEKAVNDSKQSRTDDLLENLRGRYTLRVLSSAMMNTHETPCRTDTTFLLLRYVGD